MAPPDEAVEQRTWRRVCLAVALLTALIAGLAFRPWFGEVSPFNHKELVQTISDELNGILLLLTGNWGALVLVSAALGLIFTLVAWRRPGDPRLRNAIWGNVIAAVLAPVSAVLLGFDVANRWDDATPHLEFFLAAPPLLLWPVLAVRMARMWSRAKAAAPAGE